MDNIQDFISVFENPQIDLGTKLFYISRGTSKHFYLNDVNDYADPEAYEALILTNVIILRHTYYLHKSLYEAALENVLSKLVEYAYDASLDKVIKQELVEFISSRITMYDEELAKFHESSRYLLPFLVDKLYINPLSIQVNDIDIIMKDTKSFLGLSLNFINMYSNFMKIVIKMVDEVIANSESKR